MAGGISVHGVDVTRGVPAQGMMVEVYALDPARRLVAEGRLAASGALDHAVAQGAAAGTYEVVFHVGEYFRSSGASTSAPPFLDLVPFRFTIADPAQHYHLPLKITPWGFSLFRGS
jgi:5-hydroxyisourate hydrolase